MIYVCSAPVLTGCNVFWIFVVTMLQNTKSLLIVTKQLVLFFAKKVQTICPIKCFSKWCTCTIFRPSDISWCVDKCIIEGWWWHSETSEITILCSKQTQMHFWSVLYCSKKHFISCLLHANSGANTRRLVWSAYVLHITMPIELCTTYPEMSVRPHQVSHCVRTFDAVLRNNLYRFLIRCTSSSNFFIRSLQMSDDFYKSSFFLNYSTLLYGDQMQ